MKLAYVDSSVFLAIALNEPAGGACSQRLRQFDAIVASNLVEAELRACLLREGVQDDAGLFLTSVEWVYPDRPLTMEFIRVLGCGYQKGADLWHLACAVLVASKATGMAFLTLDDRQREAAERLGFVT